MYEKTQARPRHGEHGSALLRVRYHKCATTAKKTRQRKTGKNDEVKARKQQ